MNIFVLDTDIQKNAQYYMDKHVIKMITEHAQMISTAVRIFSGKLHTINNKKVWLLPGESAEIKDGKVVINNQTLFRATHANHPSTKWVMESPANFEYLIELTRLLNDEKKLRYESGDHKSWLTIKDINVPKYPSDSSSSMTPFAQAMPDSFKSDDAVTSYRNYYKSKKSFAAWGGRTKTRDIPEWFND